MLQDSLAIIGDEDMVLGFRALGFKDYPLKEPKEFKAILEKILKTDTAICLIQDDFYLKVQEELKSYAGFGLPVFIPFSKTAKADLLDKIIKDIRLRATGVF
ncbi:MAG: V-type ATP synthase subunit F [Candidatus Omnitrophica bacterium]|nr:V-type ATP synthase subunit F [Candidatus Omnitrophota bacterium]